MVTIYNETCYLKVGHFVVDSLQNILLLHLDKRRRRLRYVNLFFWLLIKLLTVRAHGHVCLWWFFCVGEKKMSFMLEWMKIGCWHVLFSTAKLDYVAMKETKWDRIVWERVNILCSSIFGHWTNKMLLVIVCPFMLHFQVTLDCSLKRKTWCLSFIFHDDIQAATYFMIFFWNFHVRHCIFVNLLINCKKNCALFLVLFLLNDAARLDDYLTLLIQQCG